MAIQATVVPAKAGIQEILREKSVPATKNSGFRLSPERRVYGAIVLARCRAGYPYGHSLHLPASPPGRGGFITRPAFKSQDRPINRFAIVEPFLRPGQGGFETRPYPDYGYPSNRRSGAGRNPEPSIAGTLFSRWVSWIPAFAGTTGLWCGCLGKVSKPAVPAQSQYRQQNPLMVSLSNHAPLSCGASFDRLRMSGYKLCRSIT